MNAEKRWTGQRGALAPALAVGMAGLLLGLALVLESNRLSQESRRLQRAVDAAALAVARESLSGQAFDFQAMATEYVRANLADGGGLPQDLRVTARRDAQGERWRVSAEGSGPPLVAGWLDAPSVRATATAIEEFPPTEIALVLDNSASARGRSQEIIREALARFLDSLYGVDASGRPRDERGNLWVSVVPFSGLVNLYDARALPARLAWYTPQSLNPPPLRALLDLYGMSDLTHPEVPDRRARRLCGVRGVRPGELFFFDEPPAGDKRLALYTEQRVAENYKPDGPGKHDYWLTDPLNIDPYEDEDSLEQVVYSTADCPNTPLLPLTTSRRAVSASVDAIDMGWTTHLGLGLAMAASTLSPNWRGALGWGDAELPLNYNPDGRGENRKIILAMYDGSVNNNEFHFDAKLKENFQRSQLCRQDYQQDWWSGQWFPVRSCRDDDGMPDEDETRSSYFDNRGWNREIQAQDKQRYQDLCLAIRERGIRVFGLITEKKRSEALADYQCVEPQDYRMLMSSDLETEGADEELTTALLEVAQDINRTRVRLVDPGEPFVAAAP